MHIYFSGIGGAGIGPLALIAKQAGHRVSGSDKRPSAYIDYLQKKNIKQISIGQTSEAVAQIHAKHPIDWMVFSSAVTIENPKHPELVFARKNKIKISKRDELTNKIISDNNLELIAIAGTHGKTTTTAMAIWLMKNLMPTSYLVGAKLPFGDMGHFSPKSRYFIYECDEFDKNFLSFYPCLSLITGVDWDHHEIYPTRKDYQEAFRQFLKQSHAKSLWQSDIKTLGLRRGKTYDVIDDNDQQLEQLDIPGHVNRRNAWQVILAVHKLTHTPINKLVRIMEKFPGVSRRFEEITGNLYSDYAHTILKIKGALQLAREQKSKRGLNKLVIVYEPLTNRRQHYISEGYKNLFEGTDKIYWVPSYLTREDPKQKMLRPEDLIKKLNNPNVAEPADLNKELKYKIQEHLDNNDLVLCLSGGGGASLDEWLRSNFQR